MVHSKGWIQSLFRVVINDLHTFVEYLFVSARRNFDHQSILEKLPQVVLLVYFLKGVTLYFLQPYQLISGNRFLTSYS